MGFFSARLNMAEASAAYSPSPRFFFTSLSP